MQKSLLSAVVPLLLLCISSAAAQDVRYDFDKQKDFSTYKTYKWVSSNGASQTDALTSKQIVAAIDSELAKRGLAKTDVETADLYIQFQTAIGSEKQFTSFNTGWDYGPGWGGRWYGYGGMSTGATYGSTSTIYVGQLDVDMYDSTHKELVWRGTASKTLDPNVKPDKKQKNINKAVAKLLKNYPPGAKK